MLLTSDSCYFRLLHLIERVQSERKHENAFDTIMGYRSCDFGAWCCVRVPGGICTIDGRLERKKFRRSCCMGGVNRYDMGTSTTWEPITVGCTFMGGNRGVFPGKEIKKTKAAS